nr:MAG TPA: hypothetical protein [Caudoviricetes sp.]
MSFLNFSKYDFEFLMYVYSIFNVLYYSFIILFCNIICTVV